MTFQTSALSMVPVFHDSSMEDKRSSLQFRSSSLQIIVHWPLNDMVENERFRKKCSTRVDFGQLGSHSDAADNEPAPNTREPDGSAWSISPWVVLWWAKLSNLWSNRGSSFTTESYCEVLVLTGYITAVKALMQVKFAITVSIHTETACFCSVNDQTFLFQAWLSPLAVKAKFSVESDIFVFRHDCPPDNPAGGQ